MLTLPKTLGLVSVPDVRLRTICDPVTFGDKKERAVVTQLVRAMRRVMREENGAAIAAPQLGVCARVILVGQRAFCNPVLTERSRRTTTGLEGCLSIPKRSLQVERHDEIRLQYDDLLGRAHTEYFADAFVARAMQHEVDHLDGILMSDRAASYSPGWAEAFGPAPEARTDAAPTHT